MHERKTSSSWEFVKNSDGMGRLVLAVDRVPIDDQWVILYYQFVGSSYTQWEALKDGGDGQLSYSEACCRGPNLCPMCPILAFQAESLFFVAPRGSYFGGSEFRR